MAKAEIHQTSGLRGERWAWWILFEDHHPYAISRDSFPTLDEAIEDFKANGKEKLVKAIELEQDPQEYERFFTALQEWCNQQSTVSHIVGFDRDKWQKFLDDAARKSTPL